MPGQEHVDDPGEPDSSLALSWAAFPPLEGQSIKHDCFLSLACWSGLLVNADGTATL